MLLIANGGLHDIEKAKTVLDDGADIVTLGRGALANPTAWRQKCRSTRSIRLSSAPIADIKERELAM